LCNVATGHIGLTYLQGSRTEAGSREGFEVADIAGQLDLYVVDGCLRELLAIRADA
jgi:hypothetical protein